MSRSNYRNFRISELDGWMNIKDAATEIEKKQWVSLVNFNFEWNKLVSSKGFQIKYNNDDLNPIKWLLVDGENIYYTAWGKLYKNWEEVVINTWTLLDKKVHISIWWDLVFFTYEDWTEEPQYLDWDTLTNVTNAWTPRYNIIYNGKWILGWYDNDNILFSKTATPNNRLDIVDFTTYSAGGQSVGWDSKWLVTWMKVGENWLYVFKKDAVYYTNSEKDTWSTLNFIFNKITSNWAINQNAIAEVWQEIFYYDWINKAVRRLGYEQNLTTLRDVSVSDDIRPLFDTIDSNQTDATMSYKYPNLKLFLKSRDVWEAVNDLAFVYNVDNKSWTTETNKDCSVSDKGFLWSPYLAIIYEDDLSNWLVSSEIEGEFISKAYSFWDPVDFKKYWELEIAWRIDSTVTLTIWIYVDGELVDERIIQKDEGRRWTLGTRVLWANTLGWDSVPLQLIPYTERIDLFDSWQLFQFSFSYKGIWKLEISNVNIQWRADKAFGNFT